MYSIHKMEYYSVRINYPLSICKIMSESKKLLRGQGEWGEVGK